MTSTAAQYSQYRGYQPQQSGYSNGESFNSKVSRLRNPLHYDTRLNESKFSKI